MAELISYLKEYESRLGRNATVSIYGYGTTGRAIYEKIKDRFSVTIRDRAEEITDAPPCRLMLGRDAEGEIFEDALLISPSIRRDSEQLMRARARGVLLTSDTEVFFDGNKIPAFTVTGSDGKSTTATLTHRLISGLYSATLCGNIGTPFCTADQGNTDAIVAELSSFSLTYLKPHSVRAAITNIEPNHLNWHKNFEEYRAAKLAILENAREAVLPFDRNIIDTYQGDIFALFSTRDTYLDMKAARRAEIYYSIDGEWILLNGKRFISICDIVRKEEYNLKNLMCALALSCGYTTDGTVREVARSFTGISHRAEVVATVDGKRYIDSSIDTTPSRVKATLENIKGRVNIILGGRSKGLSIEPMLELLSERCEYIAIYGEVGEEYYRILKEKGFSPKRLAMCCRFDDAFSFVYDNRECADVILLCPACTSYGEFHDYRERGERFKKLVENITKQRN